MDKSQQKDEVYDTLIHLKEEVLSIGWPKLLCYVLRALCVDLEWTYIIERKERKLDRKYAKKQEQEEGKGEGKGKE